MRVEEAQWIGRQLARLDNISPLVELGSSTLRFRTVNQPHVDRLVHAPLRARSVQVVHADFKNAEGVDIAGDIFDPAVQARIRAVRPKVLLCCNMFEHVKDRKSLVDFCTRTLEPGGYLIFSGPYSYPYHKDPIDTYFRPSPEDVSGLFPRFDVLVSEVVTSNSYGEELLRRPRQLPLVLLRHLYLLSKVWVDKPTYLDINHRLLWLFRPYKLTCAVLRKH